MDRTLLSSSVLFLALTACTQSALQASGEGIEAIVEDPGTHSVESPAPTDGLVVATTESSYGKAPIASEPAPLEEPISAPLEAPVLVAEAEYDSQDEPLKERPLLVGHQVSCQAGLHRRYQLESCLTATVNPFCQHGLSSACHA